MAFNLVTFKTRAVTAIVFVVIMLAGLLWNHWVFFILFSVIHFGCWLEYHKLVGLIEPEYQKITLFHKYGIMVAGWAFMLFMAGNAYSTGRISLHTIGAFLLLISGIILPLMLVVLNKHFSVKVILLTIAGLLYISVSWGLMMHIRSVGLIAKGFTALYDKGWIIPMILIASIWINDTMAYIVGSFFGKTPFSSISPKKTWEGVAGGAILCVAVVSLAGRYLFHIEIIHLAVISIIAAVIGTLGDLLES
jgi:phosphatidate cytidylyltransferase